MIKNKKIISKSKLFNSKWYMTHYSNIDYTKIDAVEHYLCTGWKEGKNPSGYFDNDEYLRKNVDVKKAGMCPLLHYELYGRKEGREYSGVDSTNVELLELSNKGEFYNIVLKCTNISDLNILIKPYKILGSEKEVKKDIELYNYYLNKNNEKIYCFKILSKYKVFFVLDRMNSVKIRFHSFFAFQEFVILKDNKITVSSKYRFIFYHFLDIKINLKYKILFLYALLKRNKKTVLYCESLNNHNDNAFELFKFHYNHLNSISKDNQNFYFVTSQEVFDTIADEDLRKHIIIKGNFKHLLKVIDSKAIITSYIFANYDYLFHKMYYPFQTDNLFFVPHGISCDKDSFYLNYRNVGKAKRVYCASQFERVFFTENCGFTNVSVLGYPRFDKWFNSIVKQKSIFIFFTYRPDISQQYIEEVKKVISAIIENFVSFDITYCFHPSISKLDEECIVNQLKSISKKIFFCNSLDGENFNKKFSSSQILITDYSSCAYDFMYADGKKAIYYEPLARIHPYYEILSTFEKTNLGIKVSSIEDLIKNISLPVSSLSRRKQFFSHLDNKNSERVYTHIFSIIDYCLNEDYLLIKNSKYFNENFYYSKYPDVRREHFDAVQHYLEFGWKERRNPSSLFNTDLYLKKYNDVLLSGICPLLHYEKYGINEGYDIPLHDLSGDYDLLNSSSLFNRKYYLKNNKDVKNSNIDPISHYLTSGWKELRNPSKYFRTDLYLKTYPDVASANMCPLVHYLRYGKNENRQIPMPWKFLNRRPSILKKIYSKFTNIKFSIIVTSYNYEKYIKDTLDSLIEQSYKNFEIIVVDDGSTDNSVKIINDYCLNYKFIHLFQHANAQNKGLNESVKLGISKCKGDYIAFCESDDYWDRDHLLEIMMTISSYRNVNIISNDVILFDQVTPEMSKHMDTIRNFLRSNINIIDINTLKYNPIPTFSAVCVKAKILRKCNFNSPIPAWLDWWLWRQILICNKLFYVPKQITFFRIHDSFNSKNKSDKYALQIDKFLAKSNKLVYGNFGKIVPNDSPYCIIAKSQFFDYDYYISKYLHGVNDPDPIEHYLEIGWKQGNDPSPNFSTKKYLRRNVDVELAEVNPLLHYEVSGKNEGRVIFGQKNLKKIYYPRFINKRKFIQSKKVLLVTHMLNYTGAPILLLSLSDCFQNKGYNVLVLSPIDGYLKQKFIEKNIPVIIDPNAFVDENSYQEYMNLNVVFCVFNTYLNHLIFDFFRTYIPSILWIHENLSDIQIYPSLQRVLSESQDIYVPSDISRSCLLKYTKSVKILSYPIKDYFSNFEFRKSPNSILHLAVIGVYQERKGQDLFIDALKMILDDNSIIKVTLLGDNMFPKFTELLKEKAQKLDNLVFKKPITDSNAYHCFLDSIDYLICPSREDPYPLVVIDAFMHGVPVIISDRVGQKDLIVQGDNGYVFKSENVKELSSIIKQIIQERNRYHIMSKCARETFEKNFDYASVSKSILNIMDDLCKKK